MDSAKGNIKYKPRHQYLLRDDHVESSFAGKDLRKPVDTKLTIQPCGKGGQQTSGLNEEECCQQAEGGGPSFVFRTCEIHLEYFAQSWSCQYKADMDILQIVQ